MSKDSILDYSTTASENQDIGGISILGTAKPSNLDDGMRMEMQHIARGLVTRRIAKDTAYTAVKADHNQLIAFTETATCTTQSATTLTDGWVCYIYAEGGAVTINPNGSETVNGESTLLVTEGTLGLLRVYDGNFLFSSFSGSSGIPTTTIYATAGAFVHTFDSSTTMFQVEGCGGGAAGASSNTGTPGEPNYGAGGHSGWYYETDVLDRGVIATANLVIGSAGTSTPGTPVNGGTTSYSDGVNTFSWPGGLTPPSLLASGSGVVRIFQYAQTTAPLVSRARYGTAGFGSQGISFSGSGVILGGKGGDTPYGQGGDPLTAGNSNGNPGRGNGSGGSGSVKNSGTPGFNGGAGAPGIIIVREW